MKKSFPRILIAAAAIFCFMGTFLSACAGSSAAPSQELSSSPSSPPASSPAQTDNASKDAPSSTDKAEQTQTPAPSVSPVPRPDFAGIKVKALYLTGYTVGSMQSVQHYIELANSTEINSYVVDIKGDDGYVNYESSVPAVRAIKGWDSVYDADKVVKAFHDNGIYVIGRIVCFKDPVLSSKKPELALKNSNGSLFRDGNLITWLSPKNENSWPYLVDIAKEALSKGFDEIQFDYVRYPSDGDTRTVDYGDSSKQKYEIINAFLEYARKEMPNAVLSADIFGIVCVSPADTEKIGQHLEYIGRNVDFISPMIYPSHYALGQIINDVTFPRPDLDPYGVVLNTLLKARDRLSKVEGYSAKVRPYLQDFTASWLGKGNYLSYGDRQVRQQIKAVYDAGYEQWIMWNAANRYSESAFLKNN